MIRGAVALASFVLSLGACADTTIDPGATSAGAAAAATTAFAPAGAAEELLAQLLAELDGLSERIVDNAGDDAALARIDALWDASRPAVEARREDLVRGFEAAVRLAHTAVERRRPADADKARNNLEALIAAFSA